MRISISLDPNPTQWEEERMVPMIDGNGSAIVVNNVVQIRQIE